MIHGWQALELRNHPRPSHVRCVIGSVRKTPVAAWKTASPKIKSQRGPAKIVNLASLSIIVHISMNIKVFLKNMFQCKYYFSVLVTTTKGKRTIVRWLSSQAFIYCPR